MLIFPAKQIRAKVIAEYIKAAGYRGCVCFSCGNASRALKEAGVYTVDIGDEGDLAPRRWWTAAEIHKAFPDLFDATSGHLTLELMNLIAGAFQEYFTTHKLCDIEVPTGSGETILCLELAFPGTQFIPVRNIDRPTKYEERAPLNRLCDLLFKEDYGSIRLIQKETRAGSGSGHDRYQISR
jgi:hypothetical protein